MKKLLAIIICFGLLSTIAYGRESKAVNRRTTLKSSKKSVLRNSKRSVSRSSKKSVSKITPLKKDTAILSNSEVQIFDLTVNPPGNSRYIMCTFKVRNNTDQDVAAGNYKYFVNRRHPGGAWEQGFAAFLAAATIGAKQAVSFSTHIQLSLLDNQVRVAIHEGNNSTKPIITQATGASQMPPVSSLQIEGAQIAANNCEVVVRNNSQYYLWDMGVQTYLNSGGTWKSSGGTTIVSIAPGESGKAIFPKSVGWLDDCSQFKVVLYQVNDALKEQIYSLQNYSQNKGSF